MAQLIFQTAFPGDLFLSIPLMRQVRALRPQEPLVLACRPGLGDFFLREKLVDEVIEVDKRTAGGQEALTKLTSREWSYVFCPHESFRTALWMRRLNVSGARIGFCRGWNFFAFDKRVNRRKKWPDALRQLSLLVGVSDEWKSRFADLERTRAQDNVRELSHSVEFEGLPEWASMTLREAPLRTSKTICLAPGSVWATKRWTESGFVEVGRELIALGFEVCLVGSPSERELCEVIASRIAAGGGASRVSNRAGQTTLSEMVDLFSQSRALVTNDSGAMHMASVAGLPTVAVFGPTTLELGYRPWQNRASVVQIGLSCRPCGKHGADICPLGNHRCMKDINSSHVLRQLQKYL